MYAPDIINIQCLNMSIIYVCTFIDIIICYYHYHSNEYMLQIDYAILHTQLFFFVDPLVNRFAAITFHGQVDSFCCCYSAVGSSHHIKWTRSYNCGINTINRAHWLNIKFIVVTIDPWFLIWSLAIIQNKGITRAIA